MQTASYMNGNNIGGAGTVSGTTGDFTNLKATGLTLGGNTGKTSATAYDIWAANAKKATNADYATSAGSAATAAALSGNIDVSKITGLDSKIQTAINSAGAAGGVSAQGTTPPVGGLVLVKHNTKLPGNSSVRYIAYIMKTELKAPSGEGNDTYITYPALWAFSGGGTYSINMLGASPNTDCFGFGVGMGLAMRIK